MSDPLYPRALLLAKANKRFSVAHFQNFLGVDYPRAIGLMEALRSAGVESTLEKSWSEIPEDGSWNWLKTWVDAMKPLPNTGLPDDFPQWVLRFFDEVDRAKDYSVTPDELRGLLTPGDRVWGGTRVVDCLDIPCRQRKVIDAMREMLIPLNVRFLSSIHCAVMLTHGPRNLRQKDIHSALDCLRSIIPEECGTFMASSRDELFETPLRIQLLFIGPEKTHAVIRGRKNGQTDYCYHSLLQHKGIGLFHEQT